MAHKKSSYLDFHCLQRYVRIYLMSEVTRLDRGMKWLSGRVFNLRLRGPDIELNVKQCSAKAAFWAPLTHYFAV